MILRLIAAVLAVAAWAVPGTVWAGEGPGPATLKVLLASASALTDGQMAAQTGGELQVPTAVPNLQSLHPKVWLWDELAPTISSTMKNQTATITVHTGP